ncbi:MAG: restriction endonuclease [Deinococcales bacterium]
MPRVDRNNYCRFEEKQFFDKVRDYCEESKFKIDIPKDTKLGANIILSKGDAKIALHIFWSRNCEKNVDVNSIYAAVAAKEHYRCTSALVVTNSHFVETALDLARALNCKTIARDQLLDLSNL